VSELKQLVEKHIQNRIRKRGPKERKCRNCGSKFIVLISGADTCTVCGTSEVSYFSHYISYNFNKDDYLKKKSTHNRVRWFNRLLVKHVANCDRGRLSNQFQMIVRCIERMGLERGRNIVRYKFYLLI
jgi:predicted RNA-binding protein with PUA-like domain